MAALSRRELRTVNTWPGFVDALAALLMVVMFLLMVFVLAELLLNQALSGRDQALESLRSRVNELADLLSLERRASADLRVNLSQLSQDLQASLGQREALQANLRLLSDRAAEAESRAGSAESEVRALDGELDAARETMRTRAETIEALEQDVARLIRNVAALEALKRELEREAAALGRRADAAEAKVIEERALSESNRAQVALLNEQVAALREQIARLNQVLDASKEEIASKDIRIANLGAQLNAALASKVEELTRYRSEFFGRLREVLGEEEDIRIEGDRFVFQSEVLFESGSAFIDAEGRGQLRRVAESVKKLADEIPDDVPWVLQVNGHTDRVPIASAVYESNWELSAARALAVVDLLVEAGVPPERVAFAGFGEYQPLDPSGTPAANRRNRRIELKLTQP